jgi:hypothetical protein
MLSVRLSVNRLLVVKFGGSQILYINSLRGGHGCQHLQPYIVQGTSVISIAGTSREQEQQRRSGELFYICSFAIFEVFLTK